MRVEAEGTKVRVQLPKADVGEVSIALIALQGAEWALSVNQADLGTADLKPYQADVDDAEGALDDLFAESLTIEQAETLHARLFAAITKAKVAARRFNGDAEIIPFPIQRARAPFDPTPPRAA